MEIVYFATMRICCKHLRKSKKFGDETVDDGHGAIIPVAVNPAIQKNVLNRLSLLDNSNFLHEIATGKIGFPK